MKISPLQPRDFPERPEPIFDNTGEKGTDFSMKRELIRSLAFSEETTFVKRKLGLILRPPIHEGATLLSRTGHFPRLHVGKENIKRAIWNADTKSHNIGIRVGWIRVSILEHVLGVLHGMWVSADISVDSRLGRVFGISLPTKANCAQDYIDALTPDALWSPKPQSVFTVSEPTRIDFNNERKSCIILLPDDGSNELIIDLMFSHKNAAVGTQRVKCKITEDVMRRYIAGARTMSYGCRLAGMKLLDRLPFFQRFINIESSRTCAADKTRILSPRPEYEHNGHHVEPIMHEALDKLGAFGIPIVGGQRFVGTVMTFASAHEHDIAVMKACNDGKIKINGKNKITW